ncbi:MAG: hypothetical protein JEZ02_05960 [Desulfatibacillum sp.]|nr:hypothetical protein [Desulfatibacillum sp.]
MQAGSRTDPQAWEVFKADYLRQEQPTLSACYVRLEKLAEEHGWEIPSQKTIARRVEREISKPVLVLLRKGQEALLRMFPAQERDKSMIPAGTWWNGDGYKHNVFVHWPGEDGPVRPKTWFWQDIFRNMPTHPPRKMTRDASGDHARFRTSEGLAISKRSFKTGPELACPKTKICLVPMAS